MNKRHSNELYKDLRTALLVASDNVYLRSAPKTKTFPYIVFDIFPIYEGEKCSIDLWGMKGTEEAFENLADTVEALLDGYIIANQYHTVMLMTNDDRSWVRDEDENIIRIRMSFNGIYQS